MGRKIRRRTGLFAFFMLGCVPAFCQGAFEVQPFVGYKFGGNFVVDPNNDLNLSKIKFNSSTAYGVSVGVNPGELLGFEFAWNRQPTDAAGVLNGGGEYPEKINVNIDQFHGNILFHFAERESKARPYFLVGVGGTRGSGNGSSLTKFSWAIGGGLKYFFTNNMGIRAQVRYAPTYLYSTAGGVWCNWWGFCWVGSNDKFLNQGDVTIGWDIKF